MKLIYNNINLLNETASQLFFSEEPIFKTGDYRCLAPDSHRDPEKWKSYDMPAFRAAYDKKSFAKVATFRYDKNFNNWRDSTVLKNFVDTPRSMWEGTYGLPFATPLPMDRKINYTYDRSIKKLHMQGTNHYTSRKDTVTQKKIFVDSLDSSKCHLRCSKLVGFHTE